jgi:hypothetical protein
MSLPVIKLELEGMRHTMHMALMKHQLDIDTATQAAIAAYCTEENINKVVNAAAKNALDYVLKEEVERFFRLGAGRRAIADTVNAALLEMNIKIGEERE